MAGLALTGITTWLAIYIAGLFVLFQTSVGRYTIRLLPSWIRGVGYSPIVLLVLLIVVVSILNMVPPVYFYSIGSIPILQNQWGSVLVLLPLAIGFTSGALARHYHFGGTRVVLAYFLPIALLLVVPDTLIAATAKLDLPVFAIARDTRIAPSIVNGLLVIFLILTPIEAVLVAISLDEVFFKLFRVTSSPFQSLVRPYFIWLCLVSEYNVVTPLAKQGSLLMNVHEMVGGLGLLAILVVVYFLWGTIGYIGEELRVGGEKGNRVWLLICGRAYAAMLALFLGLTLRYFTDWLTTHTNVASAFLLHGPIASGGKWDPPHILLEWIFVGLLATTMIATGAAIRAALFRDNAVCLSIMMALFLVLTLPITLPSIMTETLAVIPLGSGALSMGLSLLSLSIVVAGLFRAWLFDEEFVFQAVANEVFRAKYRTKFGIGFSRSISDQALRETLPVLISSDDESMVNGLIQRFFDTYDDDEIVAWFVGHPDSLQRDWVTRQLVENLTQYRITTYSMRRREPLLTLILRHAISTGDIKQSEWVVDSISQMLFAIAPWSDDHALLLEHIIREVRMNDALNKHFIEGMVRDLDRKDRIWVTKHSRLALVSKLKRFVWSVTQDEPSIAPLLHSLEHLIDSAPVAHSISDGYFVYMLLRLLINFTRNAYRRDLLSEFEIEDLFSRLERIEGIAQDVSEVDKETHERIQATTLDLCTTLAALQQQGKTFLSETELRRLIRQYAYGIAPGSAKRQYWLPTQSYDFVLSVLSGKRSQPDLNPETTMSDHFTDSAPGERMI